MTPEQWTDVNNELTGIMGRVDLNIDGYNVVLIRGVVDTSLKTVALVNGTVSRDDICIDNPTEIARRFFYPSRRYVYSMPNGVNRKTAIAVARGTGDDETLRKLEEKATIYTPYWGCNKRLINHLKQHNSEIRLVGIGCNGGKA